jgi:hypothetical protein
MVISFYLSLMMWSTRGDGKQQRTDASKLPRRGEGGGQRAVWPSRGGAEWGGWGGSTQRTMGGASQWRAVSSVVVCARRKRARMSRKEVLTWDPVTHQSTCSCTGRKQAWLASGSAGQLDRSSWCHRKNSTNSCPGGTPSGQECLSVF